MGRRGGALASPDRVVLRSYPLRAVLGLAGEGKARGVSGLNGESPTLRGLLGTHVRGALRGEWRSGSSRAAGHPLPAPAPWAVAYLSEAETGPRQEVAARALAARGRSGPGGAGQVSAARPGPGRRGGGLHCDPGLGALTL